MHAIYIGTILLEKNRWGTREPSYRVSDWLDRFADAGFDGMELWENHALRQPEDEVARLEEAEFPVALFNTYNTCGDETAQERSIVTDMIRQLGAGGMKFNVGRDQARLDEYLANAAEWRRQFVEPFRMCCECHRGTALEDLRLARESFEQLEPTHIEMITHPFARGELDLAALARACGRRLSHMHVQLSAPDGGRLRLAQDPDFVRERIGQLLDGGYEGTFTIEFTQGVASKAEENADIETLFRNAVEDMEFLRGILRG